MDAPSPTKRALHRSARYVTDPVTHEYLYTDIYYIEIVNDEHRTERHCILRCSCEVEFRKLDVLKILAALPKDPARGSQPGELGGPPLVLPSAEIFPVFQSRFTEFHDQDWTSRFFLKQPRLLHAADPVVRKEIKSYMELELLLFESVLRHNEHPNIVKYHGCKVMGGLVVGLVLDRLLTTLYYRCFDTATPLDVDAILAQVRAALEHLHTNLYVRDDGGNRVQVPYCHNDVSVHNIMVTKDGDREVAVLMDFDSCVRAGLPLGKSMIRDPVGRTSKVEIDWRGFEDVEKHLREAFPCAGKRNE